MRTVKRINPIYLLIALNILLILFRDVLLPEETSAALAATVESSLIRLGIFGYAGIVLIYVLCGFFFVPILIPLNILGGALYGAWAGTAVAVVGVTFGCIASILSVRYVFTGMQNVVERREGLKRLIGKADRYPNLAIVMVRFAVVIPYLWQNIALAMTRSSAVRIALVTAISGIPGAAIYSFLGAGLVEADDVPDLLLYMAVPVGIMLGLMAAIAWFRSRYGRDVDLTSAADE
jgi:uncharacterized membrane protein YdjX (TVP38/TMEM64 family)